MSEITLIEKIKQDTEAKVALIRATGATEVEGIQRETEAEITALKEAHEADLKKKQDHLELVAVSRAKQSGNIAVQQVKRGQIDEIFAEANKEIEGQSVEEYVTFFKKYVVATVPVESEIKSVQSSESHKEEAKRIMNDFGFSGEITVDPSIKAGLVIETSDGVYDVTLKRLMGEKRAELEMNVVKAVMG